MATDLSRTAKIAEIKEHSHGCWVAMTTVITGSDNLDEMPDWKVDIIHRMMDRMFHAVVDFKREMDTASSLRN